MEDECRAPAESGSGFSEILRRRCVARSPGADDIESTVNRREELDMRRLPTMLASASAAALTTLAITVAVPAIADDAGGTRSSDEFPTCLRDHGLTEVPDGPDLKPWLGARLEHGDAAAERAMAACAQTPTLVKTPGPSERELRSCLTGHGVTLPSGDGRALKTWLIDHGDDDANRDAMKACDIAPPRKTADAGPCSSKESVVTRPAVAARAGKPAAGESGGAE
jgi:hypothetical protein